MKVILESFAYTARFAWQYSLQIDTPYPVVSAFKCFPLSESIPLRALITTNNAEVFVIVLMIVSFQPLSANYHFVAYTCFSSTNVNPSTFDIH